MIRLVALLSRKPGMSPEDFRAYYETRHVPLIEEINPYMAVYTRDYVIPGTSVKGNLADGPNDWAPDYDVVTLVLFKDQADFDKARAAFARPENSARIAADEENFLDRSAKRIFMTDPLGMGA